MRHRKRLQNLTQHVNDFVCVSITLSFDLRAASFRAVMLHFHDHSPIRTGHSWSHASRSLNRTTPHLDAQAVDLVGEELNAQPRMYHHVIGL